MGTSSYEGETAGVRPGHGGRYLTSIVLLCAVIWAALAIAPVDRSTWFLENAMSLVAVGLLVLTRSKLVFSNLSYSLIALLFLLHTVGAHYTYGKVPLGLWFRDAFDLPRNHYDRVVHFSFGLLIAYPFHELFVRTKGTRRFWSYCVPFLAILSFSAIYEILESLAADFVDSELGANYLGAQGDQWDAQKDMGLAGLGAFLCMLALAYLRHPKPRSD